MPRREPSPPQPRPLNSKIWRACVGGAVQIPTVNSRVYYFPRGHMNEVSSPPQNLSPLILSRPLVLCTVSVVEFLADICTDEVFAKLILHPVLNSDAIPIAPNPAAVPDDDDDIVSISKVLTPSDANNGGGFSVPKCCANHIFPALNLSGNLPTQNLEIKDVHGKVWEFRHVFRGSPKRHLLTTGWGKYVDNKKLIAGDTVVFMKKPIMKKPIKVELFVGIRRAARIAPRVNKPTWFLETEAAMNKVGENKKEEKSKVGFSREEKGKLSPKSVEEAEELAAENKPFEVVYYPKSKGWSDFVVKKEIVDEAMKVAWSPGMRVKMSEESGELSSRITWHHGVISSLSTTGGNGPWGSSPWRMLQVTWDEPDKLENSEWVSPWQVELAIPTFDVAFQPMKRFKATNSSSQMSTYGANPFSMTGLTNSTIGLNQTVLYVTSPTCMQGARHGHFSTSSFFNFPSMGNSSGDNTMPSLSMDNSSGDNLSMDNSSGDNTMPSLSMGNSSGDNTMPSLKTLSVEQNIDSSMSENLSLDSHINVPSSATEHIQSHSCNCSTRPRSISFRLFGVVIQTQHPTERCLHGTGCTENESSKGSGEIEGDDNPFR